MGRSVRISLDAKQAQQLLDLVEREPTFFMYWPLRKQLTAGLIRLDRISKSKPRAQKPPLDMEAMARWMWQARGTARSRKPSKEEKRDRRAAIREKVFARADGRCEGPVGSDPTRRARCENQPTDLAHAFGRGKGRRPESTGNCLAFCRTCHETEGANTPTSADWWNYFAYRFRVNGAESDAYEAERRADFDATRAALPASPRTVKP